MKYFLFCMSAVLMVVAASRIDGLPNSEQVVYDVCLIALDFAVALMLQLFNIALAVGDKD